jgi:molybdate-binding protein
VLSIHIRSESQRARVERMIQPLANRGIRVSGIKLADAGPSVADVRYFDPAERDAAVIIALALRELGVSAQRLQHISGSEAPNVQRRFELWLSAAPP